MVATYRSTDTDPKERFVHQQAGAGGYGNSSYIDLIAFREKDANTSWTTASDGVLEERLYYCQNQHADVVALATSAGGQREMDRYSAYGVPFGLPEGDSNSDGIANATDRTIIQGWINTVHYDVRGDADMDGDVDLTDKVNIGNLGTVTLGRGALSGSAVGNQRGVAGYGIDSTLHGSKYHVRNRVLDAETATWSRRDPLEYVGGLSLYIYSADDPEIRVDPMGTDDCGLLGPGGGSSGEGASPSFSPMFASLIGGSGPPEPNPCQTACDTWRASNETAPIVAMGQNVCAADGTVCPCVASDEQIRRFLKTDKAYGNHLSGAQLSEPSAGTIAMAKECAQEHENAHRDKHSGTCSKKARAEAGTPDMKNGSNGKPISKYQAEVEATQEGKSCFEHSWCDGMECVSYRAGMIQRADEKIRVCKGEVANGH